jgi:hypothetical protein
LHTYISLSTPAQESSTSTRSAEPLVKPTVSPTDPPSPAPVSSQACYMQVFAEIDLNSSGFICKEEFKTFIVEKFGIADNAFQVFMEKHRHGMDENKDGKLDVDEFTNLCLLMAEMAES